MSAARDHNRRLRGDHAARRRNGRSARQRNARARGLEGEDARRRVRRDFGVGRRFDRDAAAKPDDLTEDDRLVGRDGGLNRRARRVARRGGDEVRRHRGRRNPVQNRDVLRSRQHRRLVSGRSVGERARIGRLVGDPLRFVADQESMPELDGKGDHADHDRQHHSRKDCDRALLIRKKFAGGRRQRRGSR